MYGFEEIKLYKQNILIKLCEDDNLIKSLVYKERNFLDSPSYENPTSLIYDCIFPYKFVPEGLDEEKAIVNFTLTGYKPSSGGQLKAGYIFFNIMIHKNILRTDYGELRHDYILCRINSMLNGAYDFGLGKLSFSSMEETIFNNNYLGYILVYKLVDFN